MARRNIVTRTDFEGMGWARSIKWDSNLVIGEVAEIWINGEMRRLEPV